MLLIARPGPALRRTPLRLDGLRPVVRLPHPAAPPLVQPVPFAARRSRVHALTGLRRLPALDRQRVRQTVLLDEAGGAHTARLRQRRAVVLRREEPLRVNALRLTGGELHPLAVAGAVESGGHAALLCWRRIPVTVVNPIPRRAAISSGGTLNPARWKTSWRRSSARSSRFSSGSACTSCGVHAGSSMSSHAIGPCHPAAAAVARACSDHRVRRAGCVDNSR